MAWLAMKQRRISRARFEHVDAALWVMMNEALTPEVILKASHQSAPLRLARLCLIEGAPRLDAALLARLGDAFDQADPAASIALALSCSECGADVPVAVDVAPLVADAFARLADGLLRDIDAIASAYGWGEDAVLALPQERRQQYVALIAGRRRPGGARPQAVVLPA